jgi:hypothetical protein
VLLLYHKSGPREQPKRAFDPQHPEIKINELRRPGLSVCEHSHLPLLPVPNARVVDPERLPRQVDRRMSQHIAAVTAKQQCRTGLEPSCTVAGSEEHARPGDGVVVPDPLEHSEVRGAKRFGRSSIASRNRERPDTSLRFSRERTDHLQRHLTWRQYHQAHMQSQMPARGMVPAAVRFDAEW